MFREIEAFTASKSSKLRNEDALFASNDLLVVADGATDKSGVLYDGKTTGELAAAAVIRCAQKGKSGVELADAINREIRLLYSLTGNNNAESDPLYRAVATFAVVQKSGTDCLVTRVGNILLKVDGVEYPNDAIIENDAINARVQYFTDNAAEWRQAVRLKKTSDFLQRARDHIKPQLLSQYAAMNNPEHATPFYVVDGISTPKVGVQSLLFSNASCIELISDGFRAAPRKTEQASVQAWRSAYARQREEDPYAIGKYAATKPTDDHTVIVART